MEQKYIDTAFWSDLYSSFKSARSNQLSSLSVCHDWTSGSAKAALSGWQIALSYANQEVCFTPNGGSLKVISYIQNGIFITNFI